MRSIADSAELPAGMRRSRSFVRTAAIADKGQDAQKRLPWPVVLFLFGLIIPWIIPFGPLNMPVYRIVLLVMLFPCLAMWAQGKAGPIRVPDIGLLLYCVWLAVSLVRIQGVGPSIEPVGSTFIDTIGAYLLARCYIRTPEDFESMILLVAKLITLLLPFAIYEWLTGNKPILTVFSAVFPTVEVTVMPRSGFWRAQGPFAHSILFGLFCGSVFALTHLVVGTARSGASRRLLTPLVVSTALLSMSSAPIAALTLQAALMGWNWIFRQYKIRWKVLWGLVFAAYLVIEFGSNQTPVAFYVSHFTFDPGTGWYRIWTWEYGSASVLNHPIFGIGFGDWERPRWMAASTMDNFWLVIAVRHGIPALVLMLGSCLWIMFGVALNKKFDENLQNYRIAYLLCMTSFLLVGSTVYLWSSVYMWLLFLLGSGAWMLEPKPGGTGAGSKTDRHPWRRSTPGQRVAGRSSRFSPGKPGQRRPQHSGSQTAESQG